MSVLHYIIYVFWLVITYDLLEDRHIDDLTINKIFLFNHIKQMHAMSLWVCSVMNHRRRHCVGRTSVTHSAVPHVPLFVLTIF